MTDFDEAVKQLHQGLRQGDPQGDVEDGHLHGGLLHRGADLRGHRPRRGPGRRVLHRHRQPPRRHRSRRDRRGGAPPSCARRYPLRPSELAHRGLDPGGEYQWRREGEYHLFNPKTVFKLQHATRSGRYEVFKEYTRARERPVRAARHPARARSGCAPEQRPAVPIDEVEPVSEIVKRFSTGAMSYGSISAEAHENLAIAMNRSGAKSNTGEGGEDPARFVADGNGDTRRSVHQAGGVGSLRGDLATT